MKRILLTFLSLGLVAVFGSASEIYVSSNASDSGDGTKNNPYVSLSTAIENANSDDVIYLTTGTYIPSILENQRKSTFSILNKNLTIIGGYNVDFSEIEGKSLLSGDINGDDIYDEITGILTANYEDNCTRVMTINKNATVILQNLILQGGYADMTDAKLDTGGAMYIGSPVTMKN